MNKTKVLVLLFFGLMLGCSGTQPENPDWPKRFPTTGSITYKGEAIAGAEVTFISMDGKSSATAVSDSSGKFVLTTHTDKDGAVAGEHVVTIRRVDVIDKNPKEVDLSINNKGVPPEIHWIIPEKFSIPSQSKLNATVSESGPNDFPFDLK